MFDILVYLFENYTQPGGFPEVATLARKLTAVGFEHADISAALEWLSALDGQQHETFLPRSHAVPGSLRVWSSGELARLPVECRGYLLFLEDAGLIDGELRETIIERALAIDSRSVPLARLKIIALMVLWRRHPAVESLNGLLLDELLGAEDTSPTLH